MSEHPLILRYAARSDVGLVRAKNDDSAYAGRYLAVVADGMGGHAGGDVASASTVLDLIHLDRNNYGGDAGTHLADEIQTANSLLSELVHVNPKLAGMGTTVTALLLDGDRLAYAHIGDSRAYRLKDGVFEQMSSDHTFVQRMIDEGRMTEAEAEVHPHKNVLMRVLGDVDASPELDLKYFDTEPGERWLLCSDGLNFVRHEMIEEVIRHTKSLATAADTLIELTLAAGSPDNVTVVVFDIAESTVEDTSTATLDTILAGQDTHDAGQSPLSVPPVAPGVTLPEPEIDTVADLIASSSDGNDSEAPKASEIAEASVDAEEEASELVDEAVAKSPLADLDAHIRAAVVRYELSLRPHELVGAAVTANAEGKIPQLAHHPAVQRAATVLTHKPLDAAVLVEDNEESLPRARQRPLVLAILGAVIAVAIVAGAWAAYAWTQTQYFVGVVNGNVAIYNGVSQNLGPISLSHLQSETTVSVASLPLYSQQLVTQTMPASSLSAAQQIISDLQLGTGSSMPPCDLPATTASQSSTTGISSGTASGSASGSASAGTQSSSAGTQSSKTAAATTPRVGIPSPTNSSLTELTPTPSPTCIPGDGQ